MTYALRLPSALWMVPYVGTRRPGSQAVRDRPGLAEGANCQLYAYAVLRHFGLRPPELSSSGLWEDTETTLRVRQPRPLDLLLFNRTDDPWGAHVGVWADWGHLRPDSREGWVLHLCAEVGVPAVWRMERFDARDGYRVLVGIKRVVRPSPAGPSRIGLGTDH
jgi:hypothetical protein